MTTALSKSSNTPVTTQEKIAKIIDEQNDKFFERSELIPSLWTAIVSQQHHLQVAAGGTAKSMAVRDTVARITGTTYFETAFDESTTPDQVMGAPDIKSLVEEGKVRRVTDGMLPSAHYAFLDEFFNGNGVVLHSTMPVLNERIYHNNGKPTVVPLRSAFMGTNKLNADSDQAALWDRVHFRQQVGYVSDRDNIRAMIQASVLRRVSTFQEPDFTTVSLEEMDIAHDEAMSLPVGEPAWNTFLDLLEELGRNGVVISSRRQTEGMAGILGTAWLAGHDEVKVGDLSVLRHMFWTKMDDLNVVKNIVLAAVNPGEKKALELLDDLDKLKSDYQAAADLDEIKRNTAAIDVFKKAQRLTDEAGPLLDMATAAGASTRRIQDVIDACDTLRVKIGAECFDMSPEQVHAAKTKR
jgi:MoxR-like ATPase